MAGATLNQTPAVLAATSTAPEPSASSALACTAPALTLVPPVKSLPSPVRFSAPLPVFRMEPLPVSVSDTVFVPLATL